MDGHQRIWVSSSLQMQPEPRLRFCTGISCSRGGINARGRNFTCCLSSPLREEVTPLLGSHRGPITLNLNLRGSAPLRRCPCPLRPRPVGALLGLRSPQGLRPTSLLLGSLAGSQLYPDLHLHRKSPHRIPPHRHSPASLEPMTPYWSSHHVQGLPHAHTHFEAASTPDACSNQLPRTLGDPNKTAYNPRPKIAMPGGHLPPRASPGTQQPLPTAWLGRGPSLVSRKASSAVLAPPSQS